MLKLIDGSYNEINIPEDNIPEYQQTISASQFQHNLKDLSSFADTISIQPNENELVFSVTGDGVNATFRMEMLATDGSDADSGDFTEPSSFSRLFAVVCKSRCLNRRCSHRGGGTSAHARAIYRGRCVQAKILPVTQNSRY